MLIWVRTVQVRAQRTRTADSLVRLLFRAFCKTDFMEVYPLFRFWFRGPRTKSFRFFTVLKPSRNRKSQTLAVPWFLVLLIRQFWLFLNYLRPTCPQNNRRPVTVYPTEFNLLAKFMLTLIFVLLLYMCVFIYESYI